MDQHQPHDRAHPRGGPRTGPDHARGRTRARTRGRARAAALLLAAGAVAGGGAPAASAAGAAEAEVLTPVCSPDLPIEHPGCAAGRTYRGAPAPTGEAGELVHLSGPDRFATAAEIAEHGFPEADVAVLVSGEDAHLVDALSAAPLARSLAAPLLLATRDAVPAATAAYLREHGVRSVLLVGGPGSLGELTGKRLQTLGVTSVGRVAGADRYATSRAVAELLPPAEHGWAASGEQAHLVDALAASGPAARLREPLVLVADDDPIPASIALRLLGVTSTTVAGGPAGVTPEALAPLPTPRRAEGLDRYGTAAAVALEGVQRGVDAADVVLAPGEQAHLVDALAAGPLGRATLLAANDPSAYEVAEAWFDTHGLGRGTAVGAVEVEGGDA
ncbi:cell wall-binding repeat-containing protein [Kineococcus gypseus]|uniref:cell wall-binding repeat-containing protein n=1 Tax=Kineococcus gypseus TaxID=1637102 RepID=UPI003D7D4A26